MAGVVSLGCDGSSDKGDARDLALASISSRIDNTNQRLESLQAKVDATSTKLETIAAWTVDRPEPEPEPKTKPRSRPRRPVERPSTPSGGLSPDLKDPFAPEDETERCSRCIEGAEEAIECTEDEGCDRECSVDKAFLKTLKDDPGLLAKQARIVPSMSSGLLKFYGIRRGSLPKLLMVRNGDGLREIDGKAVGDEADLGDALERFAAGKKKRLELTYERKGKSCELVLKSK